jgi:hypothetical protein
MSIEEVHFSRERAVRDDSLDYKFVPVRTDLLHRATRPDALKKMDSYSLMPHIIRQNEAQGAFRRKQLILANYGTAQRANPTRRLW